MLTLILKSIYFMFPAYFANMAPVFFKNYFKTLATPIHKKWFGVNKTWRGLIVGVILGSVVFSIQKSIGLNSIVNYQQHTIILGLLLSSGAILGDLTESFFKRRLHIKPGKPWPIADQYDFIVVSLLFASLVIDYQILELLIILIATPILTILVNRTAYFFKIRNEMW